MEKSFDEITVSSLSDLQLGNSSGPGVTIPEQQSSSSSSFHREASQLINNSTSSSSNGQHQQQLQQQQQQQQRNSSINGNENNLNRSKKSSGKQPSQPSQQQQQQPPSFNPSKHLDVWLANAIRGLENATSQDLPDQLDSPTLKGGEPLSLPPNLNYLEAPNSSSPSNTGLFSPTQLHHHHHQQQPLPLDLGGGVIGGVIQQQNPYRFGLNSNFLHNDGSEFASLPPRISYQSLQQQQQQQQPLGRRAPLQRNESSSFQDLLNAQRIMTDSYINDSSDNESKNSCAKSKLEMAETLLADLNLLNGGGGLGGGLMMAGHSSNNNNGSASTASGNGGGGGGGGGGYNGTATSATSGINQSTNSNNLVVVLLKEISKLHETNKKICRNLHETKVEMEALKHSSHWGLNHRRDSISGLSTNSQPVEMRYNSFGLQSPAPTYHSQGSYSPGLVADVIREIREVSRVREEAMMDRMKTMIEERSWALNEANFRLLKESEDTKKSIHMVRSEMNQMVDRMLKLENEVINLRAQLNSHQQQHHQHHLRERDSYAGSSSSTAGQAGKLRRNSMHLNYGRISNTDEFYGGNNFNDLSNELRFSNGGGSNNMRGKIGENSFVGQTLNGGGGYGEELHDDSSNDQVLLLEKDALKLRRELQDALASKQESENRITALESIVSTLKEQVPSAVTMPQHHPGYGIQSLTTVMTPTTTASPVGMGVASSHHHQQQQQQQHQQQYQQQQYYFRTINNASPSPQLTHPPAAPISPAKLQKAAQIQSIPSSSGKQYMHLPASAINVSGPVTDL